MNKPPVEPLRLSVFFPCHNEEANVERTTAAALKACRRLADEFEVIIVNDGSKDRTAELADGLAVRHPEVRVVHHPRNLGYGSALQSGYRAARKDWVFYTDGDGQFDFEEIERMLPLLQSHDIASGYRLNRQDNWQRRLNGWLWSHLTNLLLGFRVRDVDCAFKLFPRQLFDQIEMHSTGALIDAEVLAKATHLGYRIGQVGVHHYPRQVGEQSGGNLRVVAWAFVELYRLRRRIRRTARVGSIPNATES